MELWAPAIVTQGQRGVVTPLCQAGSSLPDHTQSQAAAVRSEVMSFKETVGYAD